ncbi:solute carrier family 25 member 38 [Suillus discolor]|uniref:Solute carrier family 25 member 38 n=1 Tax=Suillus discolor TaxID=1912936 RepID=A0A9P7FEI4_9AGAM|nr:solute carrier family 25 member 38 [Suillus discolor]KAG2114693.1 solute carrier family 25 member 38 [Suillus discolor]
MKNAAVGQHLLSGALSGFGGAILLQPLDLLKTRIQQGDSALNAGNATIIWRTTKDIIRNEGIKGLWTGTSATLVRNVPGVALYFTSLTYLRSIMAKSPYFASHQQHSRDSSKTVLPKLSSQGNLIAGATTRVGVGLILNPFSILKARFESELHAYRSLSGSLLSIARMGPSELMRGFVASSLRDAPYAGLFVVIYESIKRETKSNSCVPAYFIPTAYAVGIHSFSAASAGAVATMATHPFDVIKTKMQVRSEDKYRGFTTTVIRIFKAVIFSSLNSQQRGAAGFFDGASLRMSRKILSSAIGWAVFEGMLLFMQT